MKKSLTLVSLGLAALLCGCPTADTTECGNNKVEGDEICDGPLGDSWSCVSEGFDYGEIRCSDKCEVDTSACVDDPCWSYPCGSYGTASGDIIDAVEYAAGNDAAKALAGDDGFLSMKELYALNREHGGKLVGAMIFVSTGWCPYCAAEADKLEALYQDYKERGIVLIGMITEDARGGRATADYANTYATQHNWTFPSLAGDFPLSYWLPDDDAGAVPMHVFIDLRGMRISGRFTGVGEIKLLRHALDGLVRGDCFDADGTRLVSFDCAPGTGNEQEPNDANSTPESATTLPFGLDGVFGPPTVAEGMQLDEDVIDLGQLGAGDVVDVQLSSTGGSSVYPFFQVFRLSSNGQDVDWFQMSPARQGPGSVGRQIIAEVDGHYFISAVDGRMASGYFYGGDPAPEQHSCCDGGPSFTYQVSLASSPLVATEAALNIGSSLSETISDSAMKVYPLALASGQQVTIDMTSSNAADLDPYLVLVDSADGSVLAFNDDKDQTNQVYDAQIVYTADADRSALVVASYFMVLLRSSAPGYGISVQ